MTNADEPVTRRELAEALVAVRNSALLALITVGKGLVDRDNAERSMAEFEQADEHLRQVIQSLAPGISME